MSEKKYKVYKHIFPNGKVYIGITSIKPEHRWNHGKGYFRKRKNGMWTQPLMAHAINKYGWENVKHEILYKELTKEEAEQKEIELITLYKSNQIEYGYNIENGGHVHKMSESTKQKIRENSGWIGRKHTEEERRKISEGQKGTHMGKDSALSKQVAQYDKDMNLIKIWDCVREAAREIGLSHANISKCCSGRYKTSGGFIWRYIDAEREVA